MRFRLRTPAGERDVTIPTLGRLSVHNALAAAAVGLAAGLASTRSSAAWRVGWGAPHRAELVRLRGATIVDDSYNASPGSVRGRARAAGRPARPSRRGARRDARARRRDTTSGHLRSARPPADRRSAGRRRARRRAASSRARRAPGSTPAASTTSPTTRPPSTCFDRACATATPSWSRPRAASASTVSSTRCGSSSGKRRPMTVELIQGLLLAFALVVILMPPYIRLLQARRLRQAHPRRRGPRPTTSRKARRRWAGCSIVLVVLGIFFFLRQPRRRDLRAAGGAGRGRRCWAPSTTTSTRGRGRGSRPARSSSG